MGLCHPKVGTESVETSFSQDACPSLTAPVRKLGLQTTSSLGWQSFYVGTFSV